MTFLFGGLQNDPKSPVFIASLLQCSNLTLTRRARSELSDLPPGYQPTWQRARCREVEQWVGAIWVPGLQERSDPGPRHRVRPWESLPLRHLCSIWFLPLDWRSWSVAGLDPLEDFGSNLSVRSRVGYLPFGGRSVPPTPSGGPAGSRYKKAEGIRHTFSCGCPSL